MTDILRISSPISSSWVTWMMLTILVCLLIIQRREGAVTQGVVVVCRWCIWGMLLSLAFAPSTPFSFTTFALIGGSIAAVDLLRALATGLVYFTFQPSVRLNTAWSDLTFIWHYSNIILFPICLLLIYLQPAVTSTIVFFLYACYYIALTVRILRLYISNIADILYTMIYILTVGILPLTLIIISLL